MIVCCVLGLKVHKTCRSETRASEIAYNIARGIEGSSETTVGKYLTGSFNIVIFDLLIYLCFYYLDLVIFVKTSQKHEANYDGKEPSAENIDNEIFPLQRKTWFHNFDMDS